MLPTSIAGSIVIAWPPTVSPASTVRTSTRSPPSTWTTMWWSGRLPPAT
jgi:hypothetical protein